MRFKQYVRAESLEQAWTLNQKRSNRILAGALWMRLGRGRFDTAIDLSGLGLDRIERTGGVYRIGAMVTLRALETNPELDLMTGSALRGALAPIVGVQFRNCATVGGSVFGRYGFSDVLTVLMALGAEVALFRRGTVPIRAFADVPYDRDVLTHVIVPDAPLRIACRSVRATKTDIPILTCAVAARDGAWSAVVGARPNKARAVDLPAGLARADFPAYVAGALDFGSNMRGSAEYRRHLCEGLVGRLMAEIGGGE